MKYALLNNKIFSSVAMVFLLAGLSFAQTSAPTGRRNSPFAPNPKRKMETAKASNSETQNSSIVQKIAGIEPADAKTETVATAANENPTEGGGEADSQPDKSLNPESANNENHPAAKTTSETAEKTSASLSPSEIYKIGIGDILYISLQNAPSKESTYFTVLKDGTIDYPLAGEMISVAGLTTDEIETALQEKIKLYENPQVSVKVREHNSHTYTVLGLVEKPGEKVLQREAYPLVVIRAEAIVQPKANRAIIKRGSALTETIDLKDSKSEDVLIFSGDIVEFTSADAADSKDEKQFYYIGGEIASGGQKDFHKGITLTQTILACGGLKKPSVKRVVIRRKNEAGILNSRSYDLKDIKDGKSADPEIAAGDTIEIGN